MPHLQSDRVEANSAVIYHVSSLVGAPVRYSRLSIKDRCHLQQLPDFVLSSQKPGALRSCWLDTDPFSSFWQPCSEEASVTMGSVSRSCRRGRPGALSQHPVASLGILSKQPPLLGISAPSGLGEGGDGLGPATEVAIPTHPLPPLHVCPEGVRQWQA